MPSEVPISENVGTGDFHHRRPGHRRDRRQGAVRGRPGVLLDRDGRDGAPHRAPQWREHATQDSHATLRLPARRHGRGDAEAARSIARERDLERATGMDVARLSRTLDEHLAEARALIPPRAAVAS